MYEPALPVSGVPEIVKLALSAASLPVKPLGSFEESAVHVKLLPDVALIVMSSIFTPSVNVLEISPV